MTTDDRTVSREELERLKQAGASPVRAVLHIDDRSPHPLTRRVVVGREPSAGDDVDAIVLTGDPLVSKAHVAFDVTPDGVVAIDLGSSNGTTIVTGGVTRHVASDMWTSVDSASVVTVGDTSIRVEVTTPGQPGGAPSVLAPPPAGIVTAVPGVGGSAAAPACPACGRPTVAGSRFCDGCGATLAATTDAFATPMESGAPTSAPVMAGFPSGPVVTTPPPMNESWPSGDGATEPHAEHGTSSSSRKRTLAIGAVGASVAVVAAVAGWLVFGGGGDDGLSATPLPQVSDDVEERWSADVDGASDAMGSASGVFVVAIDNDDAEVVLLDGGSGDERWAADAGRDVSFGSTIGVLDGVALVVTCDFDAACELFGFDASTGEELWSDESEGRAYISSKGTLVIQESESLELLDPRDGSRMERVRGDDIDVDGDHAYVRDDDEIEVFDLSDLSTVFGPVDVDEDSVGAIYQGGKLITGVEDELVVINADGDTDRESRVPADAIFRILPGPSGTVIADTDEGVFGLDPVDGRAEEIWSADGSLSFGFVSGDGPLVIVVESQDDGSDAEVLDAGTGDARIELRDYYETDQLIGSNGLVNLVYGNDTEATAYRYSGGDETWDDDFDGFLRLLDNGLVEIDDGEVRFYR